MYGAHDGVPERSGLSPVEVDVDPDAGGDTVGAAAGLDVALSERGSQLVALQAAQMSYSKISQLSLFDYLR